MKAQINLITIWTNDIDKMKKFYNQVLEFRIENDLGNYVEFENDGVRFAMCMRDVMYVYSSEYREESSGQGFELAFPCENPNDVDESFKKLISKGAISVHEPQDMPWNQRTALFADPDGNIHEIFAKII
ncbi:MAG: VOC family protein [Clostridium sp.]|jgi:catechol 2,3-dioxygenase-like lactoylglutathione lyase family enzyme|uniref:VOC family protein n=1 Tax=Clostridium sp. TaxID=1506 RepID=UPI0025C5220A|nr:VOC family protein [Clostridium sp.]MCH3963890.1 VOC family protein [Clostridium sp.]MCI1717009.1 VOC family protein [Clostridium sp.]MCI1801272.1 VOC family protein [Clostridium sp.]MCI1815118.1 VOC family protein [Clostridium sp.]MCI1872098.1 VOC family protein [Clostridium sp.]